MASTYETLLKALEEKTKRENAEASDTEQKYYASRVASQQQAQEQRQQNSVFDFTNQRVNNALAMQQNQDYEQPITQIESEEESDSWWDSFWAKTNEILLGLGFAVMKPLEGIVDAGAHVVGWIADKAGNTDLAQGVKDFTARDLTKEAMQSAPYQWMNYVTIGGVQDLIGSAIDGEWKVKGPYESKMWRRSTDDEYESPEWARKTAEGVGQAVGYALLALATGGVGSAIAGGGELGAVGSAVANYAPIAISAGGSATTEALQEGASYDQAMAYGALSGLTEAAAEAFVGNAVNKALGGVGGGVGAMSTLKNVKGGKGIIRGLVASANEEGMEEVFSSVLTPMWKAITYKNNEDNTFAQRYAKEFEEAGGILGVLQDYAYGAASSLIMGGATVGSNIVRSSDTKTVAGLKRGLQTVQMENYISQVAEIQNDIANEKLKIGLEDGEATTPKLKRLEAKLEKLQSEMETKFKDLLDHIEEYSNTETEGLNNAQRKQIATKEAYETSKNVDTDMLAINKLFEDSKVEALESQKAVRAYDERIKALDEQLRTNTTLTTEQMNAIRKEMADNQKARNRIANNLGLYDPETSTTYIEGKRTLRDKFKTALHERLHVALKDASVDNKVRINELIKEQLLNDSNYGKDWYDERLNKIKEKYRNEFSESSDFQKSGMTLDEAINSGKFDYWFEEEISADYLFNLFKNPAQAKKVLNGTFGGKGIANSFMNIIRSAYLGKNRPQGYKELIKALQEVSQTQNAKNTKEFNEKVKQARENLKTAKKLKKKVDKEENKIEYAEKAKEEKKPKGELARAQKDLTEDNEIDDVLTAEEEKELDKLLKDINNQNPTTNPDIRYSKDLDNEPATKQMQKVVDKYFGIKFDDNSFSEENIKSKVDKFLYNYADKTAFAKKELDLNDSDWESVIKNVKAENVDELKETLNKILLRKYNKYLNDKKEKKKDLPNDYRVTKEIVEALFDEIYETINDSDYEEFDLNKNTFDEFYNDIKAFIPQLEKEYNELREYFTEVEKTGNYKIKEFRANTTKLNGLNTLAREFFPVIDNDGNKYYENFDIEKFSKEQKVRYRQLLKQIKDARYLMPKELQKSVEEREAITQKTAQEEKELQSRIEQVKNNKEVKAGYEMVNKFAKIINQRLQNNAGKGENYSSNIRKNKLDGLSIESIEKPLADIEALDLQLNDYKAILIKNDITEAIAQKEIDELKNSEFKNLYNLRELLQKKYYEKKKVNSVEETKKTLEKTKEKLEEKKQTETKKENTEQKETFKETIKETGEAVADTITNATGTKVVYIFNEAILKEINQKNYKRKDLLAKKFIDGMLLSVNDNIVKLTDLSEDNPFRISAEETIKEIARRMTSKNGDITEDVEALIKTLKQQVKDKEIALNKKDERVSAINERLKELKEERKEIDKTLDKKNKQIKKLISLNEETLDKGKKLKQEIDDLKAKIKNNNIITETLQKDAKKAIREAHKAQRNALRETVELNEKLVSAKNRVNEYFAKVVKSRIEAKGKFKVNEDFVGFLQNWGEYFSPYTNFKLNLADCERIGMLLEKPNETHKVIIDDVEVELTNREIALTYYYNKINGSSQQYTSIYQYDMSYQEIFDLIKEGFDFAGDGLIVDNEKLDYDLSMALEHVLDDITTTDLTEIGKQQEKYEKLLGKARDNAIAQYQRYLKKRGELSLYKHSVWAKNRAQAFRRKFESYKSKFGRLSGIDNNWSKMLQKFSDDINALTPNQIANGEFVGAIKEFYESYKSMKSSLNEKGIYMPTELEKVIEQIAYANRSNLTKVEELNVMDATIITKEDIDLFSQIISGINRFMTDAKEERGAMLAGKWTKLKDASTTGIAEQDYLLEQNKKHNIKYDKYHFINGYVNPAVNFRYWDGFKTDGIFSKFYDTLELAQGKYAQNMIELMQPFADFAKKYKKEFNKLRNKVKGIKVNDTELDATAGQLLALYETTKRLWALEHLNACGFVLNENSKIIFDGMSVILDSVEDIITSDPRGVGATKEQLNDIKEIFKNAFNSKSQTKNLVEDIAKSVNEILGLDESMGFTTDDMLDIYRELKDVRSEAVREQIENLREDIAEKLDLNNPDSAYSQYLKASEEFFEKARDLKVEADMQILGFTNVSDDFYFPMYTSSLDNQVNLGELNYDNQTMSSRDYSFNQNLRSIMGALEIRNIDDIINVHLQQTATYNAYSPAIETIKRVYNWKQSGDQAGRTVANAMKLRYTKEDASKIDRYLHNLINDIQGGTVGKSNVENTFDKVFNFIRGHSIKVALGANPKVWFSQTTSIPAAMKYIQGKYLVEGLSDLVKTSKGLPEIPYLAQLRKRNGEIIRSETLTSEQDGVLGAAGTVINTVTGAINTVSESMMKPITAFDSAAIRVIWKASLLQTKNADGSWNVEKATELFTKAVNETQPNYNPLGRPEILRTKNPLLRLLVMYKTQSFQNLSNAYEAVNRIVYKLRRGIPLEQTIKDANGKIISYGDRDKAIRALIALLLQGILFSSLGYLFKRLINNDWGENTGKNLANDLGLGFVNDNLLGIMPIINKMQVDLNNDRYVKLNINGFTDNIEDTFTKLINPESLAPKDYVTIFANLTGIPATNLYKYSKTFLQYVLPNETIEKIDLGYRGKSVNKQLIGKASTERLTRTYYNMYTTEINGNIKENTRREMYRLYQNGNASVILKTTPEKFTVDGVEYSVITKEFNQTYGKVSDALNNLISSANYSKLDDEEKGWQIVKLNEAYYGAAKKVATNSSFTKFESLAYYDFTFSSDLLSIYHMLTQLEADKRLTKSQVISKYLNKQRVPTGMKYLLWWLAGYSLKDNQKSMVKRYLAQNGVSLKNTKEIIK